jgi:hypothetical protein
MDFFLFPACRQRALITHALGSKKLNGFIDGLTIRDEEIDRVEAIPNWTSTILPFRGLGAFDEISITLFNLHCSTGYLFHETFVHDTHPHKSLTVLRSTMASKSNSASTRLFGCAGRSTSRP